MLLAARRLRVEHPENNLVGRVRSGWVASKSQALHAEPSVPGANGQRLAGRLASDGIATNAPRCRSLRRDDWPLRIPKDSRSNASRSSDRQRGLSVVSQAQGAYRRADSWIRGPPLELSPSLRRVAFSPFKATRAGSHQSPGGTTAAGLFPGNR
jgi:hypothetical protein